MKRVFKYPVEVTDVFSMLMPEGAEVLTVQVQHGQPQIWALVDDAKPPEQRVFMISGTGHPMTNSRRYVGSFQMAEGRLMWHLFEAA
jgi:hypothetical protein